jgi:nitroimidazol reductase NimA-like FMN-containing flavoprotein (pyridoxamine 5'-phosphate oxidase superfamily)
MKTMAEEEVLELLRTSKIGRLGCIDNGEPYVVPINYIFEAGVVYSHSLPGLKIEALRAHPRACLQVDAIEDDFNWRSAIAHGSFEEIRVPSERRDILRNLLRHFPLLTPVESVMAQDASAPDSIVFRMRIDRLTGVAEGEMNGGINAILC